MGLYAFILAIVAMTGYGLYELYNYYMKKVALEDLDLPNEDNKNINELMRLIHNQAQMGSNKAITKNDVSKVLLMEDLDLRPKEMMRLLAILIDKNLIRSGVDSVTITPFGVQFYQVFQNDKLNISSS